MSNSSRLTGRKRYRIGFRSRLILQVEEEYSILNEWGEPRRIVDWRDATVKDISYEQLHNAITKAHS